MASRTNDSVQRESGVHASATTTTTGTPSGSPSQSAQATLYLRGQATSDHDDRSKRRIRWAEDVVNNEGMGKKSSKVCCIYHKPHEIDESSSDDSDSSSSNSDNGGDDDGAARPARHSTSHKHHDNCDQKPPLHPRRKAKKRSQNAYERQPHAETENQKDTS